jgi:hypothetical protein
VSESVSEIVNSGIKGTLQKEKENQQGEEKSQK